MIQECLSARLRRLLPLGILLGSSACLAQTQAPITVPELHLPAPPSLPEEYGPYSGHFLLGGRGLVKTLPPRDPILAPQASWTVTAWVEAVPQSPESVLIAGAGDPEAEDFRFFAMSGGRFSFRSGSTELVASSMAHTGGWHFLAASFDGHSVRFFVDGAEQARGSLHAGAIAPELVMAPVPSSCAKLPCPHFGGRIAALRLSHRLLAPAEMESLAKQTPDADLIAFEEGSKPWAVQVVQYAGNTAPQDPSTLPKQNAPFSKPKVAPLPPGETTLHPDAAGEWTLEGGWKLIEAPEVSAAPKTIATTGFDTSTWMAATVPGTVLSTMIDRGRYPDPDYGLDNLDIPEKLNKQSYWYRAEFATPSVADRPHVSLLLDGINYHAEVWLNGQHLGAMTGAFTRGSFDVSHALRPSGNNALAIRVTPAPHPGIPNVQSIALGSGLNGGAMELDGPTFMATEGWDWVPPMRDRDTGLWQAVRLKATAAVAIGDTQVITHLPLPRTDEADITVNVPLRNVSDQAVHGTLTASFEGVRITKQVTLAPGESTVALTPAEFPELHLEHPRLWWPNGYGKPELYHLALRFDPSGAAPTEAATRFGVREVSYELSLLDNEGALRRVEYDPTIGREAAEPQVDVTHAGMRQVPGGWASSITAGDDHSPALQASDDTRATPYLTIRVNGVRIAVRGGSWGMDDSRKRVSRDHLEPFFRFDREANLNIIRNWQGQNTEETFYDLADEYGMLVWNDFWEVTMDSNAEAEDPQLFLANAKDTILRYRNHPSIVMWCGRNEGVPQPIINEGLIRLTHALDGTRYYSPSSNQVNLEPSGPYSYEDPADYYTKLDLGFAVEVGTPSLPTLEWFERWIPKQDRWPITDDWAYHNWHPHDVLNQHMEAQFGAADSLEEYERDAQMMNYVDYRAIFEGFNAHLWAPNSGRLLWMTQPAWPSTLWGILSSDYDTQASYYATKKACEPVHVQLDLATNAVSVINTTRDALTGVKVSADVFSLTNQLLLHQERTLDAVADDVTEATRLDLVPLFHGGTVLVKLRLTAADGSLLSENLYWRAAEDKAYRALTKLGPAAVSLAAHFVGNDADGNEKAIQVTLRNNAAVASLNTKILTVRKSDGSEILPAFYSDNYVSLLPGEKRTLTIAIPASATSTPLEVKLRGWNAVSTTVPVTP